MLAPSIFPNVPESERCIVEVSRKIETLRRYVQFVESQGGEASHAKYAMQRACAARSRFSDVNGTRPWSSQFGIDSRLSNRQYFRRIGRMKMQLKRT